VAIAAAVVLGVVLDHMRDKSGPNTPEASG